MSKLGLAGMLLCSLAAGLVMLVEPPAAGANGSSWIGSDKSGGPAPMQPPTATLTPLPSPPLPTGIPTQPATDSTVTLDPSACVRNDTIIDVTVTVDNRKSIRIEDVTVTVNIEHGDPGLVLESGTCFSSGGSMGSPGLGPCTSGSTEVIWTGELDEDGMLLRDPLTINFQVKVGAVAAGTLLAVGVTTTGQFPLPGEVIGAGFSTVTVNCPTTTLKDPAAPTNSGDTVEGEIAIDNTVSIPITGTVQTTLDPGLTLVPGSCVVTGGAGTCALVGPMELTWIGVLPPDGSPGEPLIIDYLARVDPGVPAGTVLCATTLLDAPGLCPSPACLPVRSCVTVSGPQGPPTSVSLLYFKALGLPDEAILTWATASEVDALGFEVYRASSAAGPFVKLNDRLIPARGTAGDGAAYDWRDRPGPGSYVYRLDEVDAAGKRTPYPAMETVVGPSARGGRVYLPLGSRRAETRSRYWLR